jgi:hypothetical protein
VTLVFLSDESITAIIISSTINLTHYFIPWYFSEETYYATIIAKVVSTATTIVGASLWFEYF